VPSKPNAPSGRAFKLRDRVEANDACSTATNVWFHDDRKPQTRRCRHGFIGMVNHPRARVGQTQALQQRQLQRFRSFKSKSLTAIHHSSALLFQMSQIIQRVKDVVRSPAIPG
jgi:hypothetical protein